MNEIVIADKCFDLLISNEDIVKRIAALASEINVQMTGKKCHLICIMDGAQKFTNSIVPLLNFEHQLQYIKINSYDGMQSSGNVLIGSGMEGIGSDAEVLILEDIVDSGTTLKLFIEKLRERGDFGIRIASLLFKPSCLKHPLNVDFTGFEVGPDFVVGFGMDYDGKGRELEDIYSYRGA